MKNHFKMVLFVLIGITLISSCTKEDALKKSTNDKEQSARQTTEITLEEAQADLESLLADIDNPLSRAGGNYRRIKEAYSLPVNGAETRSDDSTHQLVHIFNFEDNQGYAIMSGDKRIPSLLALAEKGSITKDKAIDIPGVALFLEGVENMYSNVLRAPGNWEPIDTTMASLPGGYAIIGDWENTVYPQYGLCSVKWGQNSPYNKYCPIKEGEPTATGCAATAIAQLMSIHISRII
ncbi:MAG: Spi family protease inhibitor [Candidatus Egerieousia sp.]